MSGQLVRATLVAIVICVLSSGIVQAQSPAPNIQNTNKSSDISLRSNLRVNPSTLALEFNVTLGNYPGRGGLDVPVTLQYSSKVWRIAYQSYTPSIEVSFDGQYKEGFTSLSAQYSGGWTSSIGFPVMLHDEEASRFNSSGMPLPETTDCDHMACYRIDRVMIRMPDNSVHELRSSDEPYLIGNGFSLPSPAPDDLYAVDGTGMRYQRSTQTLFLADGSRYIFSSTAPRYIDANGNTLTYTGDSAFNLQNNIDLGLTDSLGRSIPPFRKANGSNRDDVYSLPGVNGVPLNYTFKWRHLGDAGVMTTPQSLNYVADFGCPSAAGEEPPVGGAPSLFLSDSAGRSFICNPETFNPTLLYQIVLPTGQTYTLTYNVYGELDKIVLPTGGYERYEYAALPPLSVTAPVYSQANRGVTKRYVSATGNSADEVMWTYAYTGTFPYGSGTQGAYVLTTTAPDGTLVDRYLHTDSLFGAFGFDIDQGKAGMVYDERQYSAPDGTGTRRLLQRNLTEWITSGSNATNSVAQQSARRNARVGKSISILLDTGASNALAKARVRNYDLTYQFSLGPIAASDAEYDWVVLSQSTAQTASIGSITLPGQPLRTSETTNLLLDTNIPQATRDAYRARNLVALMTSSRLKDPAGNIVAQSSVAYDEYALMNVGSVSGWTDPQSVYRGNVTTRGRWLNTTGNYIQAHSSYDQFGNVRTTTDPKGNQAQLGYSANNAYVTTMTTAVPDPSGQYGSSVAFTSSRDYDVTTGLVSSTTDQNGQTTILTYSDPLNRLTQVTQPNGAHITYTYFDTPGNLYVKTVTDQDSSRAIETRTYFDGLGRALRAFLYDGTASTPWVVQDTYYDSRGRVSKASNPYRVATPSGTIPSTCSVCTTTAYDGLGRVITVTSPDSSQVTSSFGASTTGTLGTSALITDQSGKRRKIITDVLGRLIEVYEDPTPGLNYKTSYSYDLLDNVTGVTQDTQPPRNFIYDSLSRLRSESNPESGTILYQYDDNGNLTQKTDARGIVTTFAYDALNRGKTIDFSDTAISPDVTRKYDGATNGKGQLWVSYAGGNESTGSNVEKTLFDSYDVLGRPLLLKQYFKVNGVWSLPYQTSRTYNLAGAIASQTYPSLHSVNYNYDAAGRLGDKDTQNLAFTGNLGDGTTRQYSTGIMYAAAGQLTQEKFGTTTPVYNKLFYNSRQQLAEILASTTGGDSSWNRGKISNQYSLQCSGAACNATDNNGNLRRQTVYIPADDQVSSFTSWYQQYDYDELNRLKRVHEYTSNSQLDWQQEYLYDRWGNRRIDTDVTKTYGTGINKKDFETEGITNRLYAPGDLALPDTQRRIRYDAAGNQIKDTYSGNGSATFDALNHITAIQDSLGNWSNYTYNADGRRTRRKINNQETWQIFGFEGELLAEYPANAAATSPQKEYGYRNGQLLVTAEAATSSAAVDVVWKNIVGVTASGNSLTKPANGNVAWDAGAVSTKAIASGDGYVELSASESNTNRMCGLSNGDTNQDYADIDFAIYLYSDGNAYIFEQGVNKANLGSYALNDVFRVAVEGGVVKYRKNGALLYTSTGTPTYPLLVDTAISIPGGTINNVKLSGTLIENVQWTNAVNVTVSGNSLTKQGGGSAAWDAGAVSTQTIVSGDGYVEFTALETNKNRMFGLSNGDSNQSYADIDFAWYAYDDGTLWVFEGGVNRGGFGTFTTGDRLRVAVEGGVVKYRKNGALIYTSTTSPTYPLLVDTAFSELGGTISNAVQGVTVGAGTAAKINWLVTDQLGTPRMVLDQTGALANVKRHDYLPFGEELFAPTGSRTAAQGYVSGDGVRQQFTSQERDLETGLDYYLSRYYSSIQGRFKSADSLAGSGNNPQSFNRYAYVQNNPLILIDPDGHNPAHVDGCNGTSLCLWKGQDPNTSKVPPARREGDSFPVAQCSGCGSPFGIIAIVDVFSGYSPVSTTNDPVLAPPVDPEPVLPPSWVDYVPVVSNARKFLFHYTTHNFEAALLDFSVMSVELGTANVGASAGAARSFATESGEAIFYSGKGSLEVAVEAARTEGGKLISDTLGGRVLNFITKPLSPRLANPIWRWGSKHFAEGASGTVRAFIREPLREYSTWRQVEYPILRNNPFVRITTP